MKFLKKATLLIIIPLAVVTAYLPPIEKDESLKHIFSQLISDQKLEGFVLVNLIVKNVTSFESVKSSELQQVVTLLTAVVQVNPFKKGKWEKFTKRYTKPYCSVNCDLVHKHVTSGDNVYQLILINSHFIERRFKQLIHNIRLMVFSFSSIQRVTKTLIVAIVSKPSTKYRQLFQSIPSKNDYSYNINILEIVFNHKRLNYRVIQFDFFNKILKIAKYSDNVKFFIDPMRNLHRLKLRMPPCSKRKRNIFDIKVI